MATLTKSMTDNATNDKVKDKVKAFDTEEQKKIREASTLGEQITVIEPLRQTAYQKLGEFEKEVLLDELKAEYEKLKGTTQNEAELTKVYEAKKAEIEGIKIKADGTIDKTVPDKQNPTMGNYVTAFKSTIIEEIKTAAETPAPATEEAEAEEAYLQKLQSFVNKTDYTNEDPNVPYPIPYYIKPYRDEYKTLVEEGKAILAKDKKTATEVQALNTRFEELTARLEQTSNDRFGLAVSMLGAILTDEEGLRDYKPSSWEKYKPILEKAKTMMDDPNATSEQLEAMADELAEATSNLESIANFHDLESTLKLWENVPSYTELYTSNTHPAFVEAYKKAQAVAENKDNDQPTIDKALQDLKDAFDQLKTRVTKVHNQDAIKKVNHDMGVNGDERNKLNDLSRKQYTPETFEPFMALYDENLRLIEDTTTPNDEENTAAFKAKADALIAAMGQLQKRAKTRDLQNKVTEAENKIVSGKYEDEGVNKLQELVNEAKTLIENPNAKQTDVDAKLEAITNAITDLVEKIDYTNLDNAITAANQVDKETLTEKSKTDLAAAIEKAQAVRDKKPVTQEEIETAATDLNAIVENLQKKADKQALTDKINEVKDKDLTNKTEDSKKDFEEALKKANEVLAKDDASQDDVNEALKNLTDADAALKDKPNKDALRNKLTEAKEKEKDIAKYTQASGTALQDEIKKAEAILENETVEQGDVDNAVTALDNAIKGLKEKADTEALKKKVEELREKDLNGYTDESKTALEEALKKAEDLLAKDDATQEEVNGALKELEEAEAGLKEKPVAPEVDKTELNEAIKKAEEAIKKNEGKDVPEDLKTALEEAKKVAEDENASSEKVKEATDNLNKAVDDFVNAITPEEVDFTTLDEALKRANEVDKDTLTDESKKDLETAIDKASEVRNKQYVSQEEVKKASDDLNKVVDNLKTKDSEIPELPDTDKLKDKLDELKDKDLSKYTDDSKKALEDAIKKAEEVLANKDASQEDVDNALKALEDAEKGLKEKDTTTTTTTEDVTEPTSTETGTTTNTDTTTSTEDTKPSEQNNTTDSDKTTVDKTELKNLVDLVEKTIGNKKVDKALLDTLSNAKEILDSDNAEKSVVEDVYKRLQDEFNKWKNSNKPSAKKNTDNKSKLPRTGEVEQFAYLLSLLAAVAVLVILRKRQLDR